MCVNSEGSGETARMRRLAWAFTGRLCDKYHNLMSWLKWSTHHIETVKLTGTQADNNKYIAIKYFSFFFNFLLKHFLRNFI